MSELYSDLKCGLTNDHIVKQPISLICGHCICKTCITEQQSKIQCKICNVETNKSELRVDRESSLVKNSIKGIY